jgi:hypothetical protein
MNRERGKIKVKEERGKGEGRGKVERGRGERGKNRACIRCVAGSGDAAEKGRFGNNIRRQKRK